MPFDPLSFYASGANAMAAPEQARAADQEAKLQQQYAPQLYAAKAKQAEQQAQLSKLQVLLTESSIQEDEQSKQALASVVNNPDTQGKPMSEVMKRGASELMKINPKAGIKMAADSAKMEQEEATATLRQQQAADAAMETLHNTSQVLDSNDGDAVVKYSDQLKKAGFEKMIPEWDKAWKAASPEQREAIKSQWDQQFKTLKQRKAEQADRAQAEKERANLKKEEQRDKQLMVMLAKATASNQHSSDREENRERNFAISKLDAIASRKDKDKSLSEARDKYEKALQAQASPGLFTLQSTADEKVKTAKKSYEALLAPYKKEVISVYRSLPKKTQEDVKPFIEDQEDIKDKETPQKDMSAQDKAAMQWAMENPKDPRAAKIRQKLGL